MRADDIARLLVDNRPEKNTLGWHTGIILSWDDLTGLNSVEINGATFHNLMVLSSGAVQPYQPDDVVGILRVGTQYFILGKIRAAGAGAGERIASDRVAQKVDIVSNTFADLPDSYGPEVTLYVGSQRRVLVVHSCEYIAAGVVDIAETVAGYQAVQVTGASNIPVETGITDAYFKGAAGFETSAAATTLVTEVNGLHQGVNTFTCKYRRNPAAPNGQAIGVNNRVLTVIPF